MDRLDKYCRGEPLKSACWIYVLLSLVPGVFFLGSYKYVAESVFRYLIPGGIACALALKYYGAKPAALSAKGLGKSLLYCAPVAVLCVINLFTADARQISPERILWICCTALGEELTARMMLFNGIRLGQKQEGLLPGQPILLSAVVFGLMHAVNIGIFGSLGAIFQILYTAALGALFAWSYQKTGCLWGGILWHMALNLTSML